MIELARAHGAAAKFPGSGGAIIGLCRNQGYDADDKPDILNDIYCIILDRFSEVQAAFQSAGYVFVKLVPNAPAESLADGI